MSDILYPGIKIVSFQKKMAKLECGEGDKCLLSLIQPNETKFQSVEIGQDV